MHLLLCAATEPEIRPVMEWLGKEKTDHVEVLLTGVGLTAVTYQLTKRLLTGPKPDFMLQAGIAGCIDDKLPLTKVVLVENEMIGDMGALEKSKFKSVFDLNLAERDEYPWKGGKLANNLGYLKESGITIVDGITVNEISTSPDRINYYRNELKAGIETMEGAAFHFVALMEWIPFLQIRALSNFAGERDKTRWVLDMAITSLNADLQRIILKLMNP